MVNRICERTLGGLSSRDDIASRVIERIWRNEAFGWADGKLKAYIWKSVRHEWGARRGARTRPVSELVEDGTPDDWLFSVGDPTRAQYLKTTVRPMQEIWTEAVFARRILELMPDEEATALMILADGGSPIDVSREMEISAWDAVSLIKRARSFVDRLWDSDDDHPAN